MIRFSHTYNILSKFGKFGKNGKSGEWKTIFRDLFRKVPIKLASNRNFSRTRTNYFSNSNSNKNPELFELERRIRTPLYIYIKCGLLILHLHNAYLSSVFEKIKPKKCILGFKPSINNFARRRRARKILDTLCGF